MASCALDKKVNFDYLEKDPGFNKFIPQSLLYNLKVCMMDRIDNF